MNSIKYIGLDVHKETVSIAVMNAAGKLVMESIIETKAATILQFMEGLRGDLHVTFEEGTWAAWLFDLLKPYVTKVVVCNPRRNALLKEGNKSDRIDARKLAELLRGGLLRPVYHGENGIRTLNRLIQRGLCNLKQDVGFAAHALDAVFPSKTYQIGGGSVLSTPYNSSGGTYSLFVGLEAGNFNGCLYFRRFFFDIAEQFKRPFQKRTTRRSEPSIAR